MEGQDPGCQVLIKDGGVGLCDLAQSKERHDRYSADKAFRYSFCILNIKDSNGVTETLWEKTKTLVQCGQTGVLSKLFEMKIKLPQ